jgi:putative membrane protein
VGTGVASGAPHAPRTYTNARLAAAASGREGDRSIREVSHRCAKSESAPLAKPRAGDERGDIILHGSSGVDWSIIGLNLLYAVLGVVLMFVAYKVIDLLTPEVHFAEELQKGNVAVGMFVAAIFISVAIVVAGALN